MKIGWCFPDRHRCGIAIYANNYIKNISDSVRIIHCNTDTWNSEKETILKKLNSCDVIHIQYEPTFFFLNKMDFYKQLVSSINKPMIVSLHELYRQFPGVYPRDQITGNILTKPIKELLYDIHHPIQSAFRKHTSFHFGADVILVHHRFQKDILTNLNVNPEKIFIMPMPLIESITEYTNILSVSKPLVFGTTGFINPNYNIPLLISLLEKVPFEWKFIWIGDIRIEEHRELSDRLHKEINRHHWNDKFIITGWVDDATQSRLLNDIDIYLAFFSHRSSSASLARALGAKRLILALKGEVTLDVQTPSGTSPLLIVDEDIEGIIETIELLIKNESIRHKQIKAVQEYAKTYNFKCMGQALLTLYDLTLKNNIQQNNLPVEIWL